MNYRQAVYAQIEKEYQMKKALLCSKCDFANKGKCFVDRCFYDSIKKRKISNEDTSNRARKIERSRVQSKD